MKLDFIDYNGAIHGIDGEDGFVLADFSRAMLDGVELDLERLSALKGVNYGDDRSYCLTLMEDRGHEFMVGIMALPKGTDWAAVLTYGSRSPLLGQIVEVVGRFDEVFSLGHIQATSLAKDAAGRASLADQIYDRTAVRFTDDAIAKLIDAQERVLKVYQSWLNRPSGGQGGPSKPSQN